MGFEVFEKGMYCCGSGNLVTLTPTQMVFSSRFCQSPQGPQVKHSAVVFCIDRDKRLIAIKWVESSDSPNSYPIRKTKDAMTRVVSAGRLASTLGVKEKVGLVIVDDVDAPDDFNLVLKMVTHKQVKL